MKVDLSFNATRFIFKISKVYWIDKGMDREDPCLKLSYRKNFLESYPSSRTNVKRFLLTELLDGVELWLSSIKDIVNGHLS